MIDTNIQQRKSKSIVNQGQSFFSGGGELVIIELVGI